MGVPERAGVIQLIMLVIVKQPLIAFTYVVLLEQSLNIIKLIILKIYLELGPVIFKGIAGGTEVPHAYPVLSFRKSAEAHQTFLSPFSRCSPCQ